MKTFEEFLEFLEEGAHISSLSDTEFEKIEYLPSSFEPDTTGMSVYNGESTRYINITKIVVPTEYDKEQLIKAFKYLHDIRCINTDLMAVNTIIHQYQCPDNIEVSHE